MSKMARDIEIKPGMFLYNSIGGRLEVMAISKGYGMFRWKGAHPFCCTIKEFKIRYRNLSIAEPKTANP